MNTENKKKLVLVVDDQNDFLQAVIDELSFLGFTTIAAKDGQEGFNIASTTTLDLIISDIRMPNKDGQWFLTELRKIKKSNPPFVFMTGFADLSIQDAYAMGVDGFLGKPLNPEKLELLLTRLVSPIESRFDILPKEKPSYNLVKKFSCDFNNPSLTEIRFGRGGAYIAFEKISFQVGDCVSFQFQFADGPIKMLEGIGTIVWKSENSQGLADEYGLSFDYITKETLSSWLNILKKEEKLEYIPKGNKAEKNT